MRKIVTVLLASLITGCGFDPQTLLKPVEALKPVVLASKSDIEQNLVKTNSYMVAFRVDEVARATFANYESEFHTFYDLLSDSHLSDPRIVDMTHIAGVDLRVMKPQDDGMHLGSILELRMSEKESSPLMASFSEVVFTSQEEAKEVLDQWEREGRIWFADPNYTSRLDGDPWGDLKTQYEKAAIEWHKQVNLYAAFGAIDAAPAEEDNEPIIAVMDSGIDSTHPSLSPRMWDNKDNKGEAGCGGDDVQGCNATKMTKGFLGNGDISPAMIDAFGQKCPDGKEGSCDGNCCHGTHVAGIIAAEPSNDIGGICPRCRIMGIKIVGKAAVGLGGEEITILDTWIAAGMKYVAAFRRGGSPVRIINASFGKFSRSRAVAALVATLFESGKGTIVIGAAGNEDSLKPQYPAGYGDAIAVANLTSGDEKQARSNFGSWVDISAPGVQIKSTVPGGSTEAKTGTSMASPVVAGIAGLIIIKKPSISIKELRAALLNSADPTIYTKGVNKHYLVSVPGEPTSIPLLGTGLVNAEAAVNGTGSTAVVAVPDRVKPGCGVVASSKTASIMALLLLLTMPFGMLFFVLLKRG